MTDLSNRLDTKTAFGAIMILLTGMLIVLVGALFLPGVGSYYIGDLIQDESYATVQIEDNEDASGELRITATGLINAEEIHVRGTAIDESYETTRLTDDGESLILTEGSKELDQSLHPGDTIELVILIESDGELEEVQTRTYDVKHEYHNSQ